MAGALARRRARRFFVVFAFLAGTSFGPILGVPTASATAVSVGPGSMEGRISVAVGDWIAVGYRFHYGGKHPPITLELDDPTFTSVAAECAGTKAPVTLVVTAPTQRYSVDQDRKDPFPRGPADATLFQGSARYGVDTPDLCDGGDLDLDHGFVFTVDVASSDTGNAHMDLQFHYRVPAAKHKDNVDCSTTWAGPAVCGAGWSRNVRVEAGPLVFTPSLSTTPSVEPVTLLMSDSATITGTAPSAGGTVTFRAFGPFDADCLQSIFESTVVVSADTTGSATVGSGRFPATAPGTYRWTARYSGDPATGTDPAESACGDEVVQVTGGPEATGPKEPSVSSSPDRGAGATGTHAARDLMHAAWAHRILLDPGW